MEGQLLAEPPGLLPMQGVPGAHLHLEQDPHTKQHPTELLQCPSHILWGKSVPFGVFQSGGGEGKESVRFSAFN